MYSITCKDCFFHDVTTSKRKLKKYEKCPKCKSDNMDIMDHDAVFEKQTVDFLKSNKPSITCQYCNSKNCVKTSSIMGFSHKQFGKQWKCKDCDSYF